MKLAAFLFGFGLLPLWVAIVVVLLGGAGSSQASEYWNVAPWLILFSIPVCVVTLFIAVITIARYGMTQGDRTQKYKAATKVFGGLILIAGVIVGILWLRHTNHKNDLEMEQKLAQDFVINNKLVIQKTGDYIDVFPTSNTTTSDGRRVKYIFTVHQKKIIPDQNATSIYAVVSVSRSTGTPKFSMECIKSFEQQISFSDPCETK